MFTNADITICNKIPQIGINAETHQKTQIRNVFWSESQKIVPDGNGFKKCNVVKVIIPIKSLNEITNKTYRSPKEWLKLNDKSRYFTFKDTDLVIKGLINSNATIKELEQNYDDIFTIKTVVDNRYGSEDMYHFYISS